MTFSALEESRTQALSAFFSIVAGRPRIGAMRDVTIRRGPDAAHFGLQTRFMGRRASSIVGKMFLTHLRNSSRRALKKVLDGPGRIRKTRRRNRPQTGVEHTLFSSWKGHPSLIQVADAVSAGFHASQP
ncbi:hypothetical protein [Burkholderia sp. Bp9143]|uniref:hypothetical protein n=1 Tax=Burkholderia sp. Bp9143 TaxID=2184574 RepID=UPI000F590C7D|nr:hypothetical protein [Burkholderia sp. Bp9143]